MMDLCQMLHFLTGFCALFLKTDRGQVVGQGAEGYGRGGHGGQARHEGPAEGARKDVALHGTFRTFLNTDI
jgi:hypothetical protein